MRGIYSLFTLLLLVASASAFSILDYQSEVTVREDGSLHVYEKMTFDLDQEYSEGYRSIRKEDFGTLSDITVGEVKVNGATVPYETVMNGDQAEIVWKKTYEGENVVELGYTISDRVQLYNDFAKVCFEHYGANWPVAAREFSARTTLPPRSADKTMHFEVYSAEEGDAYVDNLTIVIEIGYVPSGNYVGGCYLFDRDSVETDNTVDASAYAILREEREIYGSKPMLEPEVPMLEYFCVPAFLIAAFVAFTMFSKERKRPNKPEAILPPGKEEPIVVSSLVRNEYKMKELVAATIVDLINRNVIDIIELEKEGAGGPELKKERTILTLKKRPDNLKDYEKSVLDFIFAEGKEVDLDRMMKEYDKVKGQGAAKKMPVVKAVQKFNTDFKKQVKALLINDEVEELSKAAKDRFGMVIGTVGTFGMFFLCLAVSILSVDLEWYILHGESLLLAIIVTSLAGFLLCAAYSVLMLLRPAIPKNQTNLLAYGKWDAFYRGLKASRIKEYPPASAVIWGDILKYATALGLADKVKRHLSELDSALAHRVEVIDDVAIVSMAYYSSAVSIRNLSRYGNRSGPRSRSGGFSSSSSGGWSSGGGGFSGGSSGGGGFR